MNEYDTQPKKTEEKIVKNCHFSENFSSWKLAWRVNKISRKTRRKYDDEKLSASIQKISF